VNAENAAALVEEELERLARAQLEAAEEARRHLSQLIQAATEVRETLLVDTSFYTVSTSVVVMERDLAEALRATARYDSLGLTRGNLARAREKLERRETP